MPGAASRDAVGELGALRGANARRWCVVIDGPNMPNLGARDEGIYGKVASLADLQRFVAEVAAAVGVEVEPFASNHEGEILKNSQIHSSATRVDGYLINPAGLTFPARRPVTPWSIPASLSSRGPLLQPLPPHRHGRPDRPAPLPLHPLGGGHADGPAPVQLRRRPPRPGPRPRRRCLPRRRHLPPLLGPRMIVHTVSLKWNENVTPADVAEVEAALDGLPTLGAVEELLHGENLGLNPATAATCDYAFTVRLKDEASFAAYLAHPDHVAVGELLGPLVAARMSTQLRA